ncbi:hypothetical protein ACVINW_004060 [Bradyrhizobium sp. USDA 4461]
MGLFPAFAEWTRLMACSSKPMYAKTPVSKQKGRIVVPVRRDVDAYWLRVTRVISGTQMHSDDASAAGGYFHFVFFGR